MRRRQLVDDWQLSTEPLPTDEPEASVMFSDGVTRAGRLDRGRPPLPSLLEPLKKQPTASGGGATAIAYAGSVLVDGQAIWFYRSLTRRRPARALARRG